MLYFLSNSTHFKKAGTFCLKTAKKPLSDQLKIGSRTVSSSPAAL